MTCSGRPLMPPARLMSSSKRAALRPLVAEECSVTGGRQHGVNFVGSRPQWRGRQTRQQQRRGERRDESTRMHYVSASPSGREAETHRGEDFVLEIASPRELKRAVERCSEHRRRHRFIDRGLDRPAPSPESETRPANFERFSSVTKAWAVRSSSHDATTLPRRQTQ